MAFKRGLAQLACSYRPLPFLYLFFPSWNADARLGVAAATLLQELHTEEIGQEEGTCPFNDFPIAADLQTSSYVRKQAPYSTRPLQVFGYLVPYEGSASGSMESGKKGSIWGRT